LLGGGVMPDPPGVLQGALTGGLIIQLGGSTFPNPPGNSHPAPSPEINFWLGYGVDHLRSVD